MAAYNLDTLGTCYFKDGQIDKAIATQEKALKAADSVKDFDAATRKEIAGRLTISEQTAQGHIRSILSKLDVHDRTEAVAVAIRRGIVHLD